jgi:spore germination protein GerM
MNEDELRRVLFREAESTEISPDALEVIRGRIERRARWWPVRGFAFVGGTALAAAATVLIVVLGGHWVSRPAPIPPGGGPSGTTASATTTPTDAGTANVPVYYLGTTSLGPRLYREYHVVPVPDPGPASKARAAVTEMLNPGSPADPDYRSPWPSGVAVRGVTVDGGTVTVDLTGVPVTSGLDSTTVAMALKQLIWTATAASSTMTMRLLIDGNSVTTLWSLPGMNVVLERGARADVYAPVWVIDPQQGAVTGHTVSVYLAGIVSEAAIRLRILNAAGAMVSDQPVQLSAGAPALGEAHLQVPRPRGHGALSTAETGSAEGLTDPGDGYRAGMATFGIPAGQLSEEDLFRELASLHRTRLDTLRHAPDPALATHLARTVELEAEYLLRWPRRQIDPDRLTIDDAL